MRASAIAEQMKASTDTFVAVTPAREKEAHQTALEDRRGAVEVPQTSGDIADCTTTTAPLLTFAHGMAMEP